jgi:hypothetical protein
VAAAAEAVGLLECDGEAAADVVALDVGSEAVERSEAAPEDVLVLTDEVAPAFARLRVVLPWPEYAAATTAPMTSRRQAPSTPPTSLPRRARPRLPLMGSLRT